MNPIFAYSRITYAPLGSNDFKPFEHEDRVLSLGIDLAEDDLPTVKLRLRNSDLKMFDHDVVAKHTQIAVTLFRENMESIKFLGFTESVSGAWEINVEAVDLILRSHFVPGVAPKTLGKSKKQIVESLAQKIGFRMIKVTASSTPLAEGETFDAAKSLWESLTDFAKDDLAHINVLGRERFTYGRRDFSQAPRTILKIEPASDDETEVTDWSLRNDVLGKTGEFKVAGLDLRLKKEIKETADRNVVSRGGAGAVTEVHEPGAQSEATPSGGTEELAVTDNLNRASIFKTGDTGTSRTTRTTAQSKEEAKNQASGAFRESEDTQVALTITTRLRPDILPADMVEVQGIGKIYSGKYYVVSVSHTLEESAETKLGLLRNLVADTASSKVRIPAGTAAKPNQQKPKDPKKLEELVVGDNLNRHTQFVRQ